MAPWKRTLSSEDPLRIVLFGQNASALTPEIKRHGNLQVVESEPEVIVCYGGDGTLLNAELKWPLLPKVPILNSSRGHRCIPHPPQQVIEGLSQRKLVANLYTKLECALYRSGQEKPEVSLTALNEFTVHMKRINSAVRFQLWLNDDPYENALEILGDGFVVCTPFGSTAYFNKVTRGIFTSGIGIAFKHTSEHTNHMVLPDTVETRIRITRGPATLAYDSSLDYFTLRGGDTLHLFKHRHAATILTCGPVKRLEEPF